MTAVPLTEQMLRDAAAPGSFERGEGYVTYVRGLHVSGSTAQATIQARKVYLVELTWSPDRVEGRCTCAHAADGTFCKHQVAVGLCIADESLPADEPPGVVGDYLAKLDAEALRRLVTELADRDPAVTRLLEVRSALVTGEPGAASRDLVARAATGRGVRGCVDYRRSFEVAGDAQELLDELSNHLEAGAADVVRPALLKALTRLRAITLHGDDSAGVLGDAC